MNQDNNNENNQNNNNNINQNNIFSESNNTQQLTQNDDSNIYQQTNNQNRNLYSHQENIEKSTTNNSNKKIGIIAITIVAIVTIIVGVVIIILNTSKNENTIGSDKIKKQIYLNDNKKITDKISFIIKHANSNENNIFLGFSMKGISKNLIADVSSLNNDTTRIESVGSDISFYYDKINYGFDYEVEGYETKDNKTSEYIDSNKVVYKNDNYYVINNNIGKYTLYYKFGEKVSDGFRDNENHAVWYLLSIGFFDSIDSAKTKINEYSNILYICAYTDDETISKCNYKDYRFVNDMIIDMLNDYDLYIANYNQVTLNHGDVKVTDGNNEFTISFKPGLYTNFDGYTNFKLNDSDFYLKDSTIIHNGNNVKMGIYSNLSYDIEKTDEKIILEFKKTFKK